MDTRYTGELPARLEGLRRRFERWRAARTGRSRIPEALWASAALAANTYGTSRTAQVLRVNPSRLKRHLDRRTAASVPESEGEPHFVELTPFMPNGSSECVLELEDGSGAKMRVQLKGIGTPDLATISQSFWTRRS